MIIFIIKILLDLIVFTFLGTLVLAMFTSEIEASDTDGRALAGFLAFVIGFTFLRARRRWLKRKETEK